MQPAAIADPWITAGLRRLRQTRLGRQYALNALAQRALRRPTLSDQDAADLLQWGHAGLHDKAIAVTEVSDRLEAILRQKIAVSGAEVRRELKDLAAVRNWPWIRLFLAEMSRTRGDWSAARESLLEATQTAREVATRPRLLWALAHCCVLCGDPAAAEPWLEALAGLGWPLPPRHPATGLWILSSCGKQEQALELAVQRGRGQSLDRAWADWIIWLSWRHGDWAPARRFLRSVEPAATEDHADLLPLTARTALQTRDDALAGRVANSFAGLTGRGEQMTDETTAAFRECFGLLAKLAVRPERPMHYADAALRERVEVVRWANRTQARGAGDSSGASTEHTTLPASIAPAGALRELCERSALVAARRSADFESVRDLLRSWRDRGGLPEDAEVFATSAVAEALNAGCFEAAAGIADCLSSPVLRSSVAETMLACARGVWVGGSWANPAEAQKLLELLDAADANGASGGPWWQTCRQVLAVWSGKQPHAMPDPARTPPDVVRALLQRFAGDPDWHNELPESPPGTRGVLEEWLRRAAARELVSAGRWPQAAAALKMQASDAAEVVRELGFSEDAALRWAVVAAYREERAQQCVSSTVQWLAQATSPVDGRLVLAGLRAADRLGLDHSGWPEILAPLHAQQGRPERLTDPPLPWPVELACGRPSVALAALRDRVLAGTALTADLQALALLSSKDAANRDAPSSLRLRAGGVAIGAWALLLTRERGLVRFAASRYATYQLSKNLPPTQQILKTVREAANRVVGRIAQAQAAGHDLTLSWEIEQRATAAIARPDDAAPGVFPGPFLLLACDAARSVTEIALPAPAQRDRDPDRLRSWYSPLAPVLLALEKKHFAEARRLLAEVRGSALDEQLQDQAELWRFIVSAQDRTWLLRQAEYLQLRCALDCSREDAARSPLDLEGIKSRWNEALRLGGALNRRSETADEIAQIAVGRAQALQAEPGATAHRERADEESLQLLTAGWELTRHASLQGPLTSVLNATAVRRYRENRVSDAENLLLKAVEVQPGARAVCQNLFNLVGNSIVQALEGTLSQEQLQSLRERISVLRSRLAAFDPQGQKVEIQRLRALLSEEGAKWFCHRSYAAFQKDDLETAVHCVRSALSLHPRSEAAGAASRVIARRLKASSLTGDARAKALLDSLVSLLPQQSLLALQHGEGDYLLEQFARLTSVSGRGGGESGGAG